MCSGLRPRARWRERVIKEGGNQPEQRINLMSEILLVARSAAADGCGAGRLAGADGKALCGGSEGGAALIAVGEKKSDPSIPAPELAAWTMVASEMLNLDETLNK